MRKRTKKTARKTKTRKTTQRKRTTKKTAKKSKSLKKTKRSSKSVKKGGRKQKADLSKSVSINKKAHWDAYKQMQKRCGQAWKKLQADVKRKASPEILVRDKNHLLLLLGECDYMAQECVRMGSGKKR
jgi:hypothetical protein